MSRKDFILCVKLEPTPKGRLYVLANMRNALLCLMHMQMMKDQAKRETSGQTKSPIRARDGRPFERIIAKSDMFTQQRNEQTSSNVFRLLFAIFFG